MNERTNATIAKVNRALAPVTPKPQPKPQPKPAPDTAQPPIRRAALSGQEIEDLRREIMRELSCRARVFPGLIRDGRLTEHEAHDRCRTLALGLNACDILAALWEEGV